MNPGERYFERPRKSDLRLSAEAAARTGAVLRRLAALGGNDLPGNTPEGAPPINVQWCRTVGYRVEQTEAIAPEELERVREMARAYGLGKHRPPEAATTAGPAR